MIKSTGYDLVAAGFSLRIIFFNCLSSHSDMNVVRTSRGADPTSCFAVVPKKEITEARTLIQETKLNEVTSDR